MRWRRAAVPAMLLLALLAGGHFLLWRWAEAQLQQGLAQQIGIWQARGWRVTHGTPERGGWPLHARLTVPTVALAGAVGPPGGVAWSAPLVVLDVALRHPHRLVVEIEGRQLLRIGPGPAIPVQAEQARAVIPLEPGVPPDRLDLALTGLRAGPPGRQVQAAQATLSLVEQSSPSVALTAEALTLPPAPGGAAWALGEHIASLALAADVIGPLSAAPDPQARAEAWRDGGGKLVLRRLALRWGPLDLAGSATLTLDGALQPIGTAQLRLIGQAQTLDALAAGHVVTSQAARAAKAVLALMAQAPKAGGPPEVDVPLVLRDRVLTMGRIPLLRLPQLLWPDLVWSTAP